MSIKINLSQTNQKLNSTFFLCVSYPSYTLERLDPLIEYYISKYPITYKNSVFKEMAVVTQVETEYERKNLLWLYGMFKFYLEK